MLKQLAIIGAVIAPYIQQPSRAATPANEYQVINATAKNLIFYQGYSDEDVLTQPKTLNQYPYAVDKNEDFIIRISKQDYQEKPTNFYYIYQASDFDEPINVTFTGTSYDWVATIPAYEPATGLQVGEYEGVQGDTYYFDNNEITNLMMSNIVGTQREINILDGYTAKLQKEDGTWTQTLNEIKVVVTATPNTMHYNLIQMVIPGVRDFLAMNATPENIANFNVNPTLQPFLVIYGNYTNKVVFQSGNKRVRYGSVYGLDPYFFTTLSTGYKGEQSAEGSGNAWTAMDAGIRLVTKSFEVASKMFEWVIYPGITIGLFVLVPLMFSMVLWLIKLVKKGS